MQGDLRRSLWAGTHVAGSQGERKCSKCGELTEGRKPYCSEHVELNPYAGVVLEKISRREESDKAVAEKGAIAGELEDVTCIEILGYMRLRGALNFRRICRDLDLDREAAWGYVTLLQIHRLVARYHLREQGVWRIELLVARKETP